MQTVTIRLSGNGMRLKLDPSAPFEEILKETAEKFSEGSSFFRDAAIAVTFDGRELSAEEEDAIVDVITSSSSLRIICICRQDMITDTMFARAVRRLSGVPEITPVDPQVSSCKTVHGNVSAGEVIETRENLLVMGNASPGSVLVSHKSIIVLGNLLGQAFAGENSESELPYFIYAAGFMPEKFRICGLRYRGQIPQAKTLGFHSKPAPLMAYVRNGVLVTDTLEKGIMYV